MNLQPLPLALAAACLVSSCTLSTRSHPPRLQGEGIVEGHIALGIAAEEHLLHASLFGGHNDGSLAELVIWKLLRIELGIAGASLTLGPLHLGLGVLAYEPEVPRMSGAHSEDRKRHHSGAGDVEESKPQPEGVEGCPQCEAASERER